MKKRPELEATYTTGEVAEYCHVSVRTVYSWLKTGHLVATKLSPRKWIVTQTQLDAFVRPQTIGEIRHAMSEKKREHQENQQQPDRGASVTVQAAAAARYDSSEQPPLPPEMLPIGSGQIIPVRASEKSLPKKKSRRL